VASFLYRILLLVGILLLVSRWFFVIGVLLAVAFAILWLVVPVGKAVHYLWHSPRLEVRRGHAVTLTVGGLALVLAVLALVPAPNHFRAAGVVRADPFSRVYAGASGRLTEILTPSGTVVEAGQPLALMVNEELDREVELVALDLKKVAAQKREALEADPVRHLSLEGYQDALRIRLEKLKEQKDQLVIRAPTAGRWISPEILTVLGATLQRGLELGVVQGEGRHYMAAVVRQADVARLFGGNVTATEIKVRGQEGITLSVSDLQAIPADHQANRIDRPGAGPGEIMGGVAGMDSSRGALSSEPFFEVRAYLVPQPGSYLVHGQQGVARLVLPWEPLLSQWMRSIRQLFQRNYRV
jgi:putative peptide zinc metalloprotease protein